MSRIIKAFLFGPPVALLLLFVLGAVFFLTMECIPTQVKEIHYFWGQYENLLDLLPILLHGFAIWMCLALSFVIMNITIWSIRLVGFNR